LVVLPTNTPKLGTGNPVVVALYETVIDVDVFETRIGTDGAGLGAVPWPLVVEVSVAALTALPEGFDATDAI
jgi:hypothetical protein